MKYRKWTGLACVTGALVLLLLGPARAAEVHWRSQVVHIAVEGKDLKDVLRDFCASQGVPASIAGNVEGTVSGRFDMAPQRLLDTLASTFGFVWFYDGSVLSISNANDVTRQVIRMNYASPDDLRASLRNMQLSDSHFAITYDDAARTVLVNGPASYVQLVSDIAGKLDESMSLRRNAEVRVFRLKYAWAADRAIRTSGGGAGGGVAGAGGGSQAAGSAQQGSTLPGVASILSALFAGKNAQGRPRSLAGNGVARVAGLADVRGGTSGGAQSLLPPLPTIPSGDSGGLSLKSLVDASTGSMGTPGATLPAQTVSASGDDDGLPVIQADPATNSILIRDRPERMALYAPVIAQLDVRPRVIEIEAHIIEIDDNFLRQIGIDWRVHNSHLDFQTGSGTYAQNSYDGSLNPTFGTTSSSSSTDTTPVGASISAVLGDAGRYLLARVNASQSDSLVRVDGNPKVATLNNVEAAMDSKTQFYVRVSGYSSADLYSVTTGMSLRVTPMVVEENGQTSIRLEVHMEDGQVSSTEVDSIPMTTTSQIDTQAYVGLGESLLIGGYSTDSTTNTVTGVPGLSRLPLIGALFRYHSNQRSHMERIILITPRLLDL